MEMKVKRATQQAVATFFVDVQARATGHQNVRRERPRIVETLERTLPAARLMNLVENHQRRGLRWRRPKLGRLLHPSSTQFDVVPVVIDAGTPLFHQQPRKCRLAALSRPRYEGNL